MVSRFGIQTLRPDRLQSAVCAAGSGHRQCAVAVAPRTRTGVDAGYDGRLVLDPLCMAANDMLADGGTMLLVQSEFAGPRKTLAAVASSGLDTDIVAWQWIPFGPVLSSRAAWLEATGGLQAGRREEELLVIRAEKP